MLGQVEEAKRRKEQQKRDEEAYERKMEQQVSIVSPVPHCIIYDFGASLISDLQTVSFFIVL